MKGFMVVFFTQQNRRYTKVIAVPHEKLSSMYSDVKECSDLPALLFAQIQHFFENCKALEPGKWVKMSRWGSADEAREEIRKSVAAHIPKQSSTTVFMVSIRHLLVALIIGTSPTFKRRNSQHTQRTRCMQTDRRHAIDWRQGSQPGMQTGWIQSLVPNRSRPETEAHWLG